MTERDTRPTNCRFRLQDEGKAYPRSSCQACGKGVTTGLGSRCTEPASRSPAMTSEKAPDRIWADPDHWVSADTSKPNYVEYIRADVADAMVAELKAEISRLKERLDGSD